MKKAISYIALTIAGVCLVVAAYFCHFYYNRYHNVVTELDSRINSFDMRLAKLEGHKSRELTPVRIWAVISTSDKSPYDGLRFYLSSQQQPGSFEAINAKGGPLVRPELRIPAGSTTNHSYDIQIESQFGTVADAWLSHAEPYQDLAAFDEFRLYSPNNTTNTVRLNTRLKPSASVQMRFDILVLCQK